MIQPSCTGISASVAPLKPVRSECILRELEYRAILLNFGSIPTLMTYPPLDRVLARRVVSQFFSMSSTRRRKV